MQNQTVGAVILTYNAGEMLNRCLPPLIASSIVSKVLVVDSSSTDDTVQIAQRLGAEIRIIPQHEFNHGKTRDLARHWIGTDIVVMLTQDVIPVGSEMIERLVTPILDGDVSISYARQISHDNAGFLEAFPRAFNYPAANEIRSIGDIKKLGSYTFFCSNSCCAWLNAALDSVGGFPEVLMLEDTIAAAMLLRAGHKMAYCADAVVKHSHKYTPVQEFRRYFDIGYVRSLNGPLLNASTDSGRGMEFTKNLVRELSRARPVMLPYAVAAIAAKFVGYHLGAKAGRLPPRLSRHLSTQPQFWVKLGSVVSQSSGSS